MRDVPPVVAVERRGPDRRGPLVLVVLAAALAIAALKPWDGGREAPAPRSTAGVSGTAGLPGSPGVGRPRVGALPPTGEPPVTDALPPIDAPPPTDAPPPAATVAPAAHPQIEPDGPVCGSGTGWRLVTLTRTASARGRSIDPIRLVKAPTATDAAIAPVPVAADGLDGIGLCAPRRDQAYMVAYPIRTTIWRIRSFRAPERIDGLTPLSFAYDSAAETLFAPPRVSGPDIPSWPPGRYSIAVSNGDGTVWWLGLEFRSTLPTMAGE